MDGEQTIPLFPLGIVALPGAPIPLHIFEERYRQMIGMCLEKDRPFGIVYFNGERMRGAGCTVRIVQVIETYPDGRMDILTRGEERFVVREILEGKPYLEARVLFYEDNFELATDVDRNLAEKGLSLLEELSETLLTDTIVDSIDRTDLRQLSFLIAGCEGFDADEKQVFLEMTSTRARLEKGVSAMTRLLQRLQLTQEIKRIVGGNGHLPEPLRALAGAGEDFHGE
jgi:Lon protease-like protein